MKEENPNEGFKEKKKKRATVEEKLDERFRKLAEEKKQRSISMSAENSANKALTLNNFLDQKFKELRQQKLSENSEINPQNLTTKSEEITISPIEKTENVKNSNLPV